MSSTLSAVVTVAPAGGLLSAILAGKSTPDRISASKAVETATVGDLVLVTISGGQMWATSLLGRPPAPPAGADQPDSPETGAEGKAVLSPEWSGSWRNGGWRTDRNDLLQGDWGGYGVNQGAAFYGRALKGYGTLLGASARLVRETGGVFAAQTPTMLLLAGDGTRPAAFPAILATAPGPAIAVGAEASWTLPTGWLPRLGPAGDAGGIGIGIGAQASPYICLDGPGLRLSIDWRR